MYFATDEDKRLIKRDDGEYFTIDQFKEILQQAAINKKLIDMTLMTQRLIMHDFDFDKLKEDYEQG